MLEEIFQVGEKKNQMETLTQRDEMAKLTKEEIKNLNSSISIKEITFII